ncbi:MAG: PAS domain S-box protein [Syntrophaceae bacterium]|nr:PAS domain S-box protein [Syntrophaceae bacterium]
MSGEERKEPGLRERNELLRQRISELEKNLARYRIVEEQLRESEEIYRTISQKSFAGIYVVQDGRFCNVNANAASYASYTTEELLQKNADAVIHPDDKEDVKRNARDMLRGKRTAPHVFRIITKTGETRWIMETVTSITYGGRPAILGNCMDITELKLAEERLRERENLYRAIFEHTGTATIIIEEDTTISLVNEEFVRLSGYAREEWESRKSWTEFVAPGDVERMRAYHFLRRRDPAAPPRNYEFVFVDSAGRLRDVSLTVGMIPGTMKSVASFADITEQKLAAQKIRESETLYRTIFETTGTATIIIEEDMTLSLVNSEFERLSGAPKDYWEGKRKWTEFVTPRDLPRMLEYHRVRRIDPLAAPRNYEFVFADRQGKWKNVIITIAMIPGTMKSVASFADITEQKRSEAALRKREQEVQRKSRSLEEVNTALKVLLKQREDDRTELEEKVLSNFKALVLPYLGKLRRGRTGERDLALLDVLESNLANIISPFSHRLSSRHLNLTPKELQVANLVKEGKTTKEIADLMGVCPGAVSLHRSHIRNKLGLTRQKSNLRSYLGSLS